VPLDSFRCAFLACTSCFLCSAFSILSNAFMIASIFLSSRVIFFLSFFVSGVVTEWLKLGDVCGGAFVTVAATAVSSLET
jgi:hypothetical protein